MLDENIYNFIMSRIENLPKDSDFWKKYSISIDKEKEYAQKIIKILSKANEKLFFDYEEYSNEIACYEIEEAYKKGFKDSFNIFLKLIE